MRFRQPLTREQLHNIARRRDSADCAALLWEIARLRALVLRADQLQRSLGALGGGAGMILDALRRELSGEPVIAEQGSIDLDTQG